jgi:hypothetical protein
VFETFGAAAAPAAAVGEEAERAGEDVEEVLPKMLILSFMLEILPLFIISCTAGDSVLVARFPPARL